MGREVEPGSLICDTMGCLHKAQYWCAWGCLEGHIADGKYCLNCMVAKKTRLGEMQPLAQRSLCWANHLIREFFYSSTTDTTHKIMEAQ